VLINKSQSLHAPIAFNFFSQSFELLMFQVSRNIVSSRGKSLSLYPTPRKRRRPQTFGLKDGRQSGTRSSICWSSVLPSKCFAKSCIQSCPTVFASHALSVCEAIWTSRHPYRDLQGDGASNLSKWFVLLRICFLSIS
jgi:hypothetical protein